MSKKPRTPNPGFLKRVGFLFNKTAFEEWVRAWLTGGDDTEPGAINVKGEFALKYSAVWSCCRVLAETFASVPCFEYQNKKDGDRERTKVTGIEDILHNKPNSLMSPFNFAEMGMMQINTGGNLVCKRIKSGAGATVGLWPYEWKRVELKLSKDKSELKYIIDNKPDSALTRDEVFHVPGMSMNGITGLAPLKFMAEAIRLGKTYESFGNNFFNNAVYGSGVFTHPQALKDDPYKRLKDDLKKNYQGLLNAGVPLLLEDGLDFKPINFKLADAELLLSKIFQIQDICRFYRVPLHMVNELTKATFSNIEHQSLEFVMYTMLPWFKRWESNINSQLVTKNQRDKGYYIEYNMAALLRGDSKAMAQAFAIGRQWGWLSVNDIRRLLNMNRMPNGDIYLQPLNYAEAGQDGFNNKIEEKIKVLADDMHKLIDISKQGGN